MTSRVSLIVFVKVINVVCIHLNMQRLKRDLSADALKSVFSQVDTSPPVDADQSPASTEAAEV